PGRRAARASFAATSPTASRLPPHCRFRAVRAHRGAYTRCFVVAPPGPDRPPAASDPRQPGLFGWAPACRFTPQNRLARDPEAMLRPSRFATAFAVGDDSSHEDRVSPPDR